MSEFLTIEEAAAKVKVKPRTVLDWLHKRKLEGVKVGKQWRIPAQNLEAFIRPPSAEPFHLTEPAEAAQEEPAPTVDCTETLVALVRALLPEGQRVYLRDKGITELPLMALNAILAPQGLVIHAAKVRDRRRWVTCTDRVGRVEGFGLFELRAREEARC
jgi:excisionase family DNA binding protein